MRACSKFISLLVLLVVHSLTGVHAKADAKPLQAKEYLFKIVADFSEVDQAVNDDTCIPVSVQVSQQRRVLRTLEWDHQSNFKGFSADGKLTESSQGWEWTIPKEGGTLHYCTILNNLRGENYDARVTADWALFRADDLFPAAASKAIKGGKARTRLAFTLPKGWSSATRYPLIGENTYSIRNPERNFDRPTGWVQLGDFGVRRDAVAGTKIAVAAPLGQEVTRLEILTLLTFTLPTVKDWLPYFPDRLLVVSASDNMWRGALSGPGSLYIHGERALVSENGTSTILHELIHVGMQRQAIRTADWIDEGIAEYLSILLLHRAGGLTEDRFNLALKEQANWAKEADELGRKYSSGPETAKAVTIFAALHNELGDEKFKNFVHRLSATGAAISPQSMKKLASDIAGQKVKSLP